MTGFFIVFFIAFILIFVFGSKMDDFDGTFGATVACATLLSAVVALIIVSFFSLIGSLCFPTETYVETHELCEVSSGYYLKKSDADRGCPYYVYAYQIDEDTIRAVTIQHYETYVYTTEDEQPYVKITTRDFSSSILRTLLWNPYSPAYSFYILENSLVTG